MSKKDRFIFTFAVLCLSVVVLIIGFAVFAAPVNATSKPDIVMTPSHTDYLTVECHGGANGVIFDYDEGSTSTGKLRCLPIRPE